MAPGIIRVLIASCLAFFAVARPYSTATFAGPPRPKYATGFTTPASRFESIQQPASQASEIRLGPGETRDQQISRDEVQNFLVELGAGQFADIDFEWFGMNLRIAVLDSDGKKLLPNDPALNSNGPLSITILADKAGIYRLSVASAVTQKIRGKYRIHLREPHLPTTEDRARSQAQLAISEVQSAASSQTIEAYAKKIEAYAKAVVLLDEINDRSGAARALMLLGDAYKDAPKELQDPLKAQASYERAAATWTLTGYQRGEGYAKMSLGGLLRRRSLPEALEYHKQAQLLFAQIGDQRGQADALYGQSFSLMRMNQPSQAIPLLEQTLQLRRAEADIVGEAGALNMMADAYRILGEADKSLELYEQLLQKIDGLEHRSLEAAITTNRALIYDDQGFWERAKDEYARSLTMYESILGKTISGGCASRPIPEDVANCASAATVTDNLGQVYGTLGQFERGLEELGTALSIWTALGDKVGQGTATLHIGYTKFLMGLTHEALSDYESARKLQEGAKNAAGVALTNTYIGLAYASLNEPQIAVKYYDAALTIQRKTGDKRALAITLDNLGMAQKLTGDSKDALTNFSSALTLWRTIKDPDGEALTLYHSAIAQAGTDDLIAANQTSEDAIKLVESLRTRLRIERSRTAYLAEKHDYYKLDIDLKMRLSRSRTRQTYAAAAFESNEKGRARVLLDSLAEADLVRSIRGKASSSHLRSLQDERDSLQKKLAAKAMARTDLLNKQTGQQAATIDNEIARLNEKYDELEEAIKSEDPRFASLVRPVPASLAEIQHQLESDTLLLEYSLGDSQSYVWAVTSGSIEAFELRPRKEIEATANKLIAALTERNRSIKNETAQRWQRRITQADVDHDQAAAALSEMILKPVAALLGNKRLVIVADGALQSISFAGLRLPASAALATAPANTIAKSKRGRPTNAPGVLVDDHEVVYEPSASVFVLQRRELENQRSVTDAVFVLANPVFEKDDPRVTQALARNNRERTGSSTANGTVTTSENSAETGGRSNLKRALGDIGLMRLPALPNSKIEASSIIKAAGTRPSKIAIDFAANRATAMSPQLSKYRMIHFATHAVVDFAHPEFSGIVLSMVDEKGQSQDGYLRLPDIYNLNLPADLVVLSACQTAVGKPIRGEGLIALTRGFMYAGARRVVASLWKVDDAATADLMSEFYEQMYTKKLVPAAALRAAQQKISRQPARRSPYYWAGFVLQGEWK